MVAHESAMEVHRRWRLTFPVYDAVLDRVLARNGLKVCLYPLVGRLREVIIGDNLVIGNQLDRYERRWHKAHALGHRLIHTGNQFFFDSFDSMITAKQEWQAESFAGWLFLGDLSWAWPGITVQEAAEEAMVPPDRLEHWWKHEGTLIRLRA